MRKNVLAAAVAFAGCIVFPSAYLLSDRSVPYEYIKGEILPPDPAQGGQISVHWTVKINRFCPGWVQRDVTDRRGYVWHNAGTPVKNIGFPERGDYVDIVNTFELPRMLGPGPATYQAHVIYKCNFLQRQIWPITVTTPKLEFTIGGTVNDIKP